MAQQTYARFVQTRVRKVLQTRVFKLLATCCLCLALFGGGVCVVLDLPDEPWVAIADIVMVIVTLFFLVEFVMMCIGERHSYPFSWFFFMDLIGTVSMVFEISFLFGPAGKVEAVEADINTVLLRTVRAAKAAARAGRLSKVLKLLRTCQRSEDVYGDQFSAYAKVLNSRLMSALSKKVSTLTIVLVLGVPLFGIGRYPVADLSMQAWAISLENTYSNAYDFIMTDDHLTGDTFERIVRSMVSFYEPLDYFPYRVQGYSEPMNLFSGEQGVIPGANLLNGQTPSRKQSMVRVITECVRIRQDCNDNTKPTLWFDFTAVRQHDALMDMTVVIFIVFCMCVESYDLSRTLDELVVTHVERMMAKLEKVSSALSRRSTLQIEYQKTSSINELEDSRQTEIELLEHMFDNMSSSLTDGQHVATQIAEQLANFNLDAANDELSRVMEIGHAHFQNPLIQPLTDLLANLNSYSSFLPDTLFTSSDNINNVIHPNAKLAEVMTSRETSWNNISCVLDRIRDVDYNLLNFHSDICASFPELSLYACSEDYISSGLTGQEEYQRTLGAFYAVYCLLRLDIDGKMVFSYGIDLDGTPRADLSDNAAHQKRLFYESVPWDRAEELMFRAGMLQVRNGETVVVKDRVRAMLVLTAIHDIMKVKELLPVCQHEEYKGYRFGETMNDHDIALDYVLEHYPRLLPSFCGLEPGQRAPILFAQGKMGFNNGWLVQGEAPPGPLFTKMKKVVEAGRASKSDINFYFVHWISDIAGAEPFGNRPWPGADKLTNKFPVKVFSAFLDSFAFVDHLATSTEVEVMEMYLVNRWQQLGLMLQGVDNEPPLACMRLALMAQGFEQEVIHEFGRLPNNEKDVLVMEMSRTACREQFVNAPLAVRTKPEGPALLIQYSPALLQKAQAEECGAALRILVRVLETSRILFPLSASRAQQHAIIRIDALKVHPPREIEVRRNWYLLQTGSNEAEVVTRSGDQDHAGQGKCVQLDLRDVSDWFVDI